MKSLVQRYAIAAVGFAAAAVWLGVGLVKGLECLLAFLFVSLVVTFVQRRQFVVERRHARRARTAPAGFRRQDRADDGRARRHARGSDPSPWPKRSLYDDETDSGEWPRPVEYGS
jgi:hypothetical protein